MNKTVWKPVKEIELSLKDADKVAIISCGACANLSNTGGPAGLKYFKNLLKERGKEVTLARCVIACCPEEIMRQTMSVYKKQIAKSDALVVLSCAAGIKSAFLCRPEVPVVSVLDPVGSVAVTDQDNYVANSVCTACGHCVITYTGGICPLSECPAKSRYGPCKKAPVQGDLCTLDQTRACIWKRIEGIADLAALARLRRLHQDQGLERPSLPEPRRAPDRARRASGRLAARLQVLERAVRSIR